MHDHRLPVASGPTPPFTPVPPEHRFQFDGTFHVPIPGEHLRAILMIFDRQSGNEIGVTCAGLRNGPKGSTRLLCELITADHPQVELDPTLPFADALMTFLATKDQHGPHAADEVIAR